jgi:hypothetical protein
MESKRRRELALAGAAVVLLVVAVWSVQRGTVASTDVSAPASTGAVARPRGEQKEPAAELDITALQGERPEPEESTRNPFRFRPRAAPPPSQQMLEQQRQQAAAAEQAAGGPVEPPPPPRIPLKYIGEMTDPRNAGRRVAILSDARGVYYGSEGEVVEGRYRIVRIGVESIELAYLDGRGRQTIRQTGQ